MVRLPLSCSYLNEGNVVDTLGLLVGSLGQVLVDVLEVGDEHVLDEVLVLFDVIVFEEDLVANHSSLHGEIIASGSDIEGFLLKRLCLRLHY